MRHPYFFELFSRMMGEPRYDGQLYGEISALTQANRTGKALETLISRQDWHTRLVNGSDYPLPGVMPLFTMRHFVKNRYINREQADILTEVRKHNVLLFDLVLKRCLHLNGNRFSIEIFHSRRVFDQLA